MLKKRFFSVFLSAAMSVPIFAAPVLADEPSNIVFDGTDENVSDNIGDIGTEDAAVSNETEASDLAGTAVDMEQDINDEITEDITDISYGDAYMTTPTAQDASLSYNDALKGLSTSLVNGSFEYPFVSIEMLDAANGSGNNARWYSQTTDDFEILVQKEDKDQHFGWKSTAAGNTSASLRVIELVSQKYTKGKEFYDRDGNVVLDDDGDPVLASKDKTQYSKDANFAAYDGVQCAELCGRDQSSLYQNLRTYEGETLDWGLSHRARQNQNTYSDTMALFIGPSYDNDNKEYSDVTYSKPGSTSGLFGGSVKQPNYDMFMWMAELLVTKSAAEFPTTTDQRKLESFWGISKEHTIYVSPEANSKIKEKSITRDNYQNYFSLRKTNTCTQEWRCWIITDGRDWQRYTGKYYVPQGQDATTFAFTALTGDNSLKEGNNLDSVIFDTTFPLDVKVTTGGTGKVYVKGVDAEDKPIATIFPVLPEESHYANYPDGTKVTITATPESENDVFLGMYIDGIFYDKSNEMFKETDGVYSTEITMDAAKFIQIIFSLKSAVIYDPNGGKYNGITTGTTIYMSANDSTVDGKVTYNKHVNDTYDGDGKAKPLDPAAMEFFGWYFARAGLSNNSNTVITHDHTVEYVAKDSFKGRFKELSDSGAQTLQTIDTEETDDSKTFIDPNNDMLIVTYKLKETATPDQKYFYCVPAESGLTFIAQWQCMQKAIVVTKGTRDMHYSENGDGGTVSTVITRLMDGAVRYNGDDGGFGCISDRVLMEATPKQGYTFMGWYTQPNGGERLSSADAYFYSISTPKKVYARFSAYTQFPYLSFVSESSITDEQRTGILKDTNFDFGSHIIVGNNNTMKISGYGGEINYGNTISTGFIANTVNSNDWTTQYCTWIINLPIEDGIYIKKSDSDGIKYNEHGITFDEKPLLEDSTDVAYNRGGIYKVSSVSNPVTNDSQKECLQLRFIDRLPNVTGGAAISYGLVIDNLYAPGADASFDCNDITKPTVGQNELDLDIKPDTESIVHAPTIEEYLEKTGYPLPDSSVESTAE